MFSWFRQDARPRVSAWLADLRAESLSIVLAGARA
jgi:hypothetical protein